MITKTFQISEFQFQKDRIEIHYNEKWVSYLLPFVCFVFFICGIANLLLFMKSNDNFFLLYGIFMIIAWIAVIIISIFVKNQKEIPYNEITKVKVKNCNDSQFMIDIVKKDNRQNQIFFNSHSYEELINDLQLYDISYEVEG